MSAPHASVPSDESRPVGFPSAYHSFSAQFHRGGGGHDAHQQNAWKVDAACTHMRTELYARMREALPNSLQEGRVAPAPANEKMSTAWMGRGTRFSGEGLGGCWVVLWRMGRVGEGWGGGCSGGIFSGDGGGCDERTPAGTLFWGCTGGAVAIEHGPTCPVLSTPHPSSVVISPV